MPDKPGIYQYLDSKGKIIYIGKAKSLKKRVSSYFNSKQTYGKTALLVRNIFDIKHMVVDSEEDALLLENNLIKKYQPKYNIKLKDDKTYPWICVKNEQFPRVFKTRNVINDGSEYYGPYTSVTTVNTLLDLFRKLYKLRTCNYKLTSENIVIGKYKVCLEYHIGNCKGPCVGLVKENIYNQYIEQIKNILKGNIFKAIKVLKDLMQTYIEDLNFEDAQEIKDKLIVLEKFQSKSTVVNPKISDIDVFSIDQDEKYAFVNYLKIIQGAIIQTYSVEIQKNLNETKEELLQFAIIDIRQKYYSKAKEILVPFPIDITLKNIKFYVPRKGEKKHLLELSIRNSKYQRLEKEKQLFLTKSKENKKRILETIQKDLQMKLLPERIECFDNSNIQGSVPVASCVVFINSKPAKNEYRHFNIKTVKGPNDFASMEEVIYRRYLRLLQENKQLPQLIVIDGGKGQLTSALKAFDRLKIRGKITIIGIAKKLEEIYFPDDPIPLFLDKNSETLKIIQQIRDEAHRFGITFHKQKRSKGFISSELDKIEGIGPITIKKLLSEFGSVQKIKKVSENDLIKIIGKNKAELINKYFNL